MSLTTAALTLDLRPASLQKDEAMGLLAKWVALLATKQNKIPPAVEHLCQFGASTIGKCLTSAQNANDLEDRLLEVLDDRDAWSGLASLAKQLGRTEQEWSTATLKSEAQSPNQSESMGVLLDALSTVSMSIVHLLHGIAALGSSQSTLEAPHRYVLESIIEDWALELMRFVACEFALVQCVNERSPSWLESMIVQRAHSSATAAISIVGSIPGSGVPESAIRKDLHRSSFNELVRMRVEAEAMMDNLAGRVESGTAATVDGSLL